MDLAKLGLRINESNLANIESYKNLSYQIDQGMQTIAEKTDQALLDLVSGGDTAGASRVMSSLIESVTSYMSETGDPLVSENMVQGADPGASSQAEVSGTENVNLTEESGDSGATGTGDAGTAINTVSSEASSGNVTEEAVKTAADSDPASRALELLKALQSGQTSKADTDNVL